MDSPKRTVRAERKGNISTPVAIQQKSQCRGTDPAAEFKRMISAMANSTPIEPAWMRELKIAAAMRQTGTIV